MSELTTTNTATKKKAIIVLICIALLVTVPLVIAATYVYSPSNQLTIKEKAPTPTVAPTTSPTQAPIAVSTTLTADKTGTFNSGDTLDLIASTIPAIPGLVIAFQEVLGPGNLGAPGFATTNAQGVAIFHFTPSPVSVDTDRTFLATPQP